MDDHIEEAADEEATKGGERDDHRSTPKQRPLTRRAYRSVPTEPGHPWGREEGADPKIRPPRR